jgi:hypothetical protein
MIKEQLIQIAKVGFPERVKQFINFENTEIHSMGGVHRLYDKDNKFDFMLPKDYYISVHIGEDNFVQIQTGHRAFNHYAAIKEMECLGLINCYQRKMWKKYLKDVKKVLRIR